jgi:hypothetical protein
MNMGITRKTTSIAAKTKRVRIILNLGSIYIDSFQPLSSIYTPQKASSMWREVDLPGTYLLLR